jgi:cytochrome c-type biogenesis protein CcmH
MKRLLLVLAAVACMGAASDPAETLKDPAQEARARHLFRDIRCLVCQNESIDDSEADLARDLRVIVRQQIVQGRTDEEIRTFLVDRYGEFVLFRPPFTGGNAILWLTPVGLVAVGAGLWLLLLRRRGSTETLTEEEEARVADLSRE